MRLGMGLGLGNLLSGQPLTGFPNDFSFNFDGSNDYLELPTMSPTGTQSIAFWFKASVLHAGPIYTNVDATSNYTSIAIYDGKLQVTLADSQNSSPARETDSTYNDNNWHHAVVVREDTSTCSAIYIDGALANTNTSLTWYGTNTQDEHTIGHAKLSSTNYYFNGLIDEFAVWNTALSASDVAKLGSKPLNLSKASTYATDRTSNLKLWLRAGDKVLPESDASIARSDFYTDFDGSNDYVDTSATFQSTFRDSFSISMWVKPSDGQPSGEQSFFGSKNSSNEDRIHCNLQADGDITFFYKSNNNAGEARTDNVAFPNGDTEWTHFSLVADNIANQLNIYKNGIKQAVAGGSLSSVTMSDWTSSDELFIGARDNNGTAELPYGGAISNLSIYQTALDAQTIKQFSKSRYTPMRDNRFSVVDFDGTNDSIVASTTLDGTYTISAWVNLSATGSNSYIVDFRTSGGTGYWLFNTSNPSAFNISSGTSYVNGSTGTTITTGAWNHVVVSGITVESSVASIGRANDGNYATWGGSMSSVSIYSGTKSAEEVYALYSKGITYDESSESDLQHYYRMGSDTSKAYPTIADSSSNSNDGTITNGASDDIVQQMVAGYDMGAFESTGEELGGSEITSASNTTFSGVTSNDWSVPADVTKSFSNDQMVFTMDDDTPAGYVAQFSAGNFVGGSGIRNGFLKVTLDVDSTTTGSYSINNAGGSVTAHIFSTSLSIGVNTIYANVTNGSSGSYFRIFEADVSTGDKIVLNSFDVQKVLQSADLSDTHPAIIDATEPILGAEVNTVANATSPTNETNATTGWAGASATVSSVAEGYTSDYSLKVVTSVSEGYAYSSGWTVDNDSIYKLSITWKTEGTETNEWRYGWGTSSGSGTYGTVALDGLTDWSTSVQYIKTTSTSLHLFLQEQSSTSNALALYVDSISIKEVQGNPGTMTNQDSADLVYSSVLPDQSFLTGVNSAYNFLDLDGSDEYIAHSNISFTGSFSISSWINLDNVSSGRPIVGDTGNNNWFKVVDADTAGIRIAGGTATEWDAGMTFPTGSWAYVAVVRNASNEIIVYVNGVAYTSNQPTLSGTYVLNALGQKGNGQYFDGKIGQIALYNKALSATEVSAIYTLGRHGNLLDSYSDNLKGYWAISALDASTGLSDVGNGTIYDRSGQSNHGTATNTESTDLASSPNAEPNGYAKQDTNRTTTTP